MRLLRGAYGRVAEATGYTPEHVRAVHKGRRRNAIVEALLLEEAEKAAKAARVRERLRKMRQAQTPGSRERLQKKKGTNQTQGQPRTAAKEKRQ